MHNFKDVSLNHSWLIQLSYWFKTCLFTGRNEVVAKVIFLHLSVILFTGGGGLPQCMLGYHPSPRTRQTPNPRIRHHPPRTRHTPPPIRHHPLGPGRPPQDQAPPGSDTPPQIRHHHPQIRPPQTWQTCPPQTRQTPPLGSRLQHTVYKRPVRILLECILVLLKF